MKKIFLFVALCMMCYLSVWANAIEKDKLGEGKKYEFYQVVMEPTADELQQFPPHDMMDQSTLFLMDKLKSYTYTREEVVPGESMQRIVSHKPEIYKAVVNIQKGLQKAMKKGDTPATEAMQCMNRVVRVALSAFYDEQSGDFEKALRENRQNFQHQISLFMNVILK